MSRLFFWFHLIVGLAAGLIVFIMCVTGAALTYQRQLQYWADTHHYRVDAAPKAARLPVDDLVALVESTSPTPGETSAVSVAYRADPTLPVALSVRMGDSTSTLYANPYSGQVLGPATGQAMRRVFSSILSWHRWLALTGEHRSAGRALTGASNLLFLLLVLSGLYLWWPASLTWRRLRQTLWFRTGLPPRARHFNWHNVLGFWTAIPMLVLIGSGLVISYPWASNGVYWMFGEQPPQRGRGTSDVAIVAYPVFESTPASLEDLFTVATTQEPDWRIVTLRMPEATSASVAVTVDRGDGGQPHLRDTLTLDRTSGAVLERARFTDQTPARQTRSLLRFAHTGEAAGPIGQTIAGLACVAGAVLVYTGVSLSWRRFLAWRRRRAG